MTHNLLLEELMGDLTAAFTQAPDASATTAVTTAVSTAATAAAQSEDLQTLIAENTEQTAEKINAFGHMAMTALADFIAFLPTVLIAAVILVVGWLLTKLVIRITEKGMKRIKAEPTVISFMNQLVRILLYILLFSIVLSILGVPTTSIIAVIGTAGVAIGLALKDSLSNIAGGFILLVAKPFKLGDFIHFGEYEGYVNKISILYTSICTIDNRVVFIPNGKISSDSVVNFTALPKRRVDCVFGISYNDDYDKAVSVIREVIAGSELFLTEPKQFIGMWAHNESSIDIMVRVWANTKTYWDARFYLIEHVRKAFIENGIEIPFRQVDVHVIKD